MKQIHDVLTANRAITGIGRPDSSIVIQLVLHKLIHRMLGFFTLIVNMGQVGLKRAESIIHLVNPNVVEVDASVDEIDVALVEPGLMAMITLDALPNAMLRGEVASVATLATSQSGVVTYGVVIKVLSPEGFGLKEGMSATIEIVQIQAEDVLLVPAQAISRSQMNQVVQVVVPMAHPGRMSGHLEGQPVEPPVERWRRCS